MTAHLDLSLDIRPCGDSAVLVDVGGLDQALDLRAALQAAPPPGLIDLVAAARSVLVKVHPGSDLRALERSIRALPASRQPRQDQAPAASVEIPVVYDGEDLDAVASATALTVDEVIATHTGQTWTVGFAGFAPGFGYLVGEHGRLSVARHSVPRTTVPPGSVALAGAFSAIYPRESPGGWQLIGRTNLTIWDVERTPPALLLPGTTISFVRQT